MVQEIVPENDLRSLPPRAALYARFRSEMSPEAIPARCHISLSTRKPWLGSNRLRNTDPRHDRHELGVINAV